MDTHKKLNTAIRMIKVANAAVEREYGNCSTVNIYAEGSKYRQASYRVTQLRRIIENITKQPYC